MKTGKISVFFFKFLLHSTLLRINDVEAIGTLSYLYLMESATTKFLEVEEATKRLNKWEDKTEPLKTLVASRTNLQDHRTPPPHNHPTPLPHPNTTTTSTQRHLHIAPDLPMCQHPTTHHLHVHHL
ncbi:hypothetical protein JHK82_033307 [Glycine max]|nr:hypothetical protein JHK82_033307 [Glycine max]